MNYNMPYNNPWISPQTTAMGQTMYSNAMSGYQNQQATNILPQQQVMSIDGPESIQQLRMAPNSSVLLMEKNRAIVWLCVSDSLGNITPTAYDITQHVDTPPVDTASLETRVTSIESSMQSLMARMEELSNGNKPNAGSVKSKQSNGKSGESGTD